MLATFVKSMKKGANVALPAGLTHIRVGLGWEAPDDGPFKYDLDSSAFMLKADGKVGCDEHFVFFSNLKSPDGSVKHLGDSLDGETGQENDEVIDVDLARVPGTIDKIVFVINIYDAVVRGQKFGDLDNAVIRLINPIDGTEITRFNIAEGDIADETAMIFGELYRHNGNWKFRAVAQGYKAGFATLVSKEYGVDLGEETPADNNSVPPTFQATPTPLPVPPAPAFAPLNFSKGEINVAKGQVVTMKRGRTMTMSLKWLAANKDLGLIALVAYKDGMRESFDWRKLRDTRFSEIIHSGDVTHGGANACEKITITPNGNTEIDSIAIVAYSELSNGVGSFYGMKAHAVIDNGEGDVATVRLHRNNPIAYHVVIATIVFGDHGQMDVRQVGRYSGFGSERRPVLSKGGKIKMNAGDVVFKGGCSSYSWYF